MDKIDWALLRTQKEWLTALSAPEAEGLLNLLDHIQDTAVANGVPTEVVFGKM